ncbi:MAG TPA: hypothetical protein VFU47_02085 [Armatimonadota bacterium]|nr:hypothetical protein [Armatimonadota bacterium]
MNKGTRSHFSRAMLPMLALLCIGLILPAWAQALWTDDAVRLSDPNPQTITVNVWASASNQDQTINILPGTSGPALSSPTSIVMPAGQTYTTFTAVVGPTQPNDWVGFYMKGPSTQGSLDVWFQ